MERVSSIFSQIVKLVPRGPFDEAVQRHQGDKHAKGMTCWAFGAGDPIAGGIVPPDPNSAESVA